MIKLVLLGTLFSEVYTRYFIIMYVGFQNFYYIITQFSSSAIVGHYLIIFLIDTLSLWKYVRKIVSKFKIEGTGYQLVETEINFSCTLNNYRNKEAFIILLNVISVIRKFNFKFAAHKYVKIYKFSITFVSKVKNNRKNYFRKTTTRIQKNDC